MERVKINWNRQMGKKFIEMCEEPKENYDYILYISEDAVLKCSLDELKECILFAISLGNFDMFVISDFSETAYLKKISPENMPTYIIKPPLFTLKPISLKNRTNNKRKDANNNQSIFCPNDKNLLCIALLSSTLILLLVAAKK
jgi:hypothetical protein